MKKYIPNILTSLRIAGAITLIFLDPFSVAFFIVYGLSATTDVFDGFLARKFNATSKFGNILDSISDLLLYGVMGIKIIPTLSDMLPPLKEVGASCSRNLMIPA